MEGLLLEAAKAGGVAAALVLGIVMIAVATVKVWPQWTGLRIRETFRLIKQYQEAYEDVRKELREEREFNDQEMAKLREEVQACQKREQGLREEIESLRAGQAATRRWVGYRVDNPVD